MNLALLTFKKKNFLQWTSRAAPVESAPDQPEAERASVECSLYQPRAPEERTEAISKGPQHHAFMRYAVMIVWGLCRSCSQRSCRTWRCSADGHYEREIANHRAAVLHCMLEHITSACYASDDIQQNKLKDRPMSEIRGRRACLSLNTKQARSRTKI
jgi:hypothetical protein